MDCEDRVLIELPMRTSTCSSCRRRVEEDRARATAADPLTEGDVKEGRAAGPAGDGVATVSVPSAAGARRLPCRCRQPPPAMARPRRRLPPATTTRPDLL